MNTEREWPPREGAGDRNRKPYNQNREGYGNYEDRQRRPYSNDRNDSYGNRAPRNSNSGAPLYSARPDSNDGQVRRKRPRVGEAGNPSYGTGNSSYGNNRFSSGSGNTYGNRDGNRERSYNNQGSYGNRFQQQGDYRNRPQQGNFNRQGQNRQRTSDYNPNAKYSQVKQIRYREDHLNPNDPIRLNKYLANAGICSRREADDYIQAGAVKVNGVVVSELGTKVVRGDNVMFHDEPVKLEHKVYVLLNKPKNCVTTTDDPQERMTVMNLVKNACKERIFPVGRLDRNTTGVLLLTNDGELAAKLTHPKFLKKKIYHVWLDKPVAIEDMQKIAEGIDLEDGEIHADAISYASEEDKSQIGIEIHSGRNRIVRRIFETLGYHVKRLDRVYFAGLTKKHLPRGKWRHLSEKEVVMLRMGAFE